MSEREYPNPTSLQTAAGATGVGIPMDVFSFDGAVLEVSGTFVGTITVEGLFDKRVTAIWTILPTFTMALVAGTTLTAPGLFLVRTAGLDQIRANITAYTSGAITVKGRAIEGPL